MATTEKKSVAEQLAVLGHARKAVLTEPNYWSSVVPSILPITTPNNAVEVRRWGADFIAEAAATPAVPNRVKKDVCLKILTTLRILIEEDNLDEMIMRSVILAAASVYPFVVRWIASNAHDNDTWETMQAIKSRILRIWDGARTPVRLCCIKFAQRVVLAQTASNGGEAKHSGLDVSLTIIPPNHPLLDPRHLEAEATGLLDRMLGILQDNSSDAVLVDATLNTLSVLIRTRPATSGRIVNTVLNFNPLKLASSQQPLTPKAKVLIKSMEKTTRMLLIHITKRDPQNPMNPRIQQHVERLMRSRIELLEEGGARKRALLPQPDAPVVTAKRQKLEEVRPVPRLEIPPLGPGPHSLGAVFTISTHPGIGQFDATVIPSALAARISVTTLATLPIELLNHAIAGVRDRLVQAAAAQPLPVPVTVPMPLNPQTSPLDVEDDDDDYEPDFYPAEDNEQILNKLDNAPAEVPSAQEPETVSALATLGTFKLPPPPALDPSLAARVGHVAAQRVFAPLHTLEESTSLRKAKAGINRLAASSFDRDSWLTVIMRIATRGTAGLEDNIKPEDTTSLTHAATAAATPPSLSDNIRELLYNYVLEDFRRRIDVAIAWLCEEWYADRLAQRSYPETSQVLHYEKWALRLVDGILPYLAPQDKVLIRFLGEIPELSRTLLDRVKSLCRDPSTVQLALTSLLYLVMMKPPARETALDVVADIWVEYEDARQLAGKYLVKWRPGFVESRTKGVEGGAVAIAA